MTTYTTDGFNWLADRNIRTNTSPITKIAVGTGTAVESVDDSDLSQTVYASLDSYSNVSIQESNEGPGRLDFIIALKGGTEVAGGTKMTEIGVFIDGSTSGDHETDANDILIARDVFDPVTIPSGFTVERTITIDYT